MEWYVVVDGRRCGPMDEDGLRNMAAAGELTPADLVWNPSMGQEWAPASTVPGLFVPPPPAAAPPPGIPSLPLPPDGGAAAPADAAAPSFPHLDGGVSCRAAVRPAWERMKTILFRPFDAGKWLALGFSAWLATLGENSSSGYRRRSFEREGDGGFGPGEFDISALRDSVQEFMDAYGNIAIAVAVGGFLVFLVLSLLFMWLRARGKFMLLDNVVHNRADIHGPWREFMQHGNSLFRWYIVLGLIGLVVMLAVGAAAVFAALIPCLRAGGWVPSVLPSLIAIGTVWLAIAILLGYVTRFTEDFVVPLMYRFDLTVSEAWGRFGQLYRGRAGAFIVYGLFYLLLGLLAFVCMMLFTVLTCCVGGCLLALPYIGAVVLLPVTVFFRAYSVEYLAQLGPAYRLFPDEAG